TNGNTATSSITGNLNLNDDVGVRATFAIASGATTGIDLDIPALISSGGISKTGPGTLQLSGTNTFSGGLLINQGTVRIATMNNANTNGPLGNNSSISLGSLTQSGTLEYTGANASSNMPISLSSNTGVGTIQVDGAATNLTLTGAFLNNGGFTKSGPGTLT